MEERRNNSNRSRRGSRRARPQAPLCLCGCGKPTRKAVRYSPTYDIEAGEYFPYRRGHNRVEYLVDPASGCWVWQKAVSVQANGSRYGCLRVHGVGIRSAHRVYYERAYGPIPNGLEIDHLCGVTLCCNPQHLQAVDHRTNVRRGRATKLSKADVDHIRTAFADGEKVIDLAEQYGVTAKRVYDLTTGKERFKPFYDPDGPVDPTGWGRDQLDRGEGDDLRAAA